MFLNLRARDPAPTFDDKVWMSLVYGDAQQFLGVTATVTLEEAALECVRSGFPRFSRSASCSTSSSSGSATCSTARRSSTTRPGTTTASNRSKLERGLDAVLETDVVAGGRAFPDVNALAASGVSNSFSIPSIICATFRLTFPGNLTS